MDQLTGLRAFMRVVEMRSFTAAADHLALSQSQVSKAIAEIEQRLAVRLLNRTTRKISPTEAGTEYYHRCRRILRDLDEADAATRRVQDSPTGILRLDASAIAAQFLVLPNIFAFQEKHPGLEIQLSVNDRRIDLIEEGVDLALRIGSLDDSSLVVRWAGSCPTFLAASPSYLDRVGRPETPEELGRHAFLLRPGRAGAPIALARGAETHSVRPRGALRLSNKVLVRDAVIAGQGIGVLPLFMIDEDLASGRLEAVLPHFQLARTELCFLHPYARGAPLKVKSFVDYLLRCWRESGQITIADDAVEALA